MIEVNLLPGAVRRAARRSSGLSFGFSRPKLSFGWNRGTMLSAAAWVVSPALIGSMFLGARDRRTDLALEIEAAVQDSTRYAALIETSERLTARRDTIAQKLQIIQEIDAGRYVWPHIMDEVSRALPAYTWITGISQLEGGPLPKFRVEGRTGNTFALTQFMKDLEASMFVRGVRLASTELVKDGDRLVHAFQLEASFEEPPADAIETVPLFAMEE